MNWISRGREEKCGKVGKVVVVGTTAWSEDVKVGVFIGGEFAEAEGEVGVLVGCEAGTSDIVGADASGSSDGGRSDHVSVLVAAIAINSYFLLFSNESSIRSIFDTNSRKRTRRTFCPRYRPN